MAIARLSGDAPWHNRTFISTLIPTRGGRGNHPKWRIPLPYTCYMGYTGLTLKLGPFQVLTNSVRAEESPRVGDSNSIQNLNSKHHAFTVQSEKVDYQFGTPPWRQGHIDAINELTLVHLACAAPPCHIRPLSSNENWKSESKICDNTKGSSNPKFVTKGTKPKFVTQSTKPKFVT